MKTIGVIGAGKIGKTIATYLSSEGFTVKIADVEPRDIDGFVQLDASDKTALTQFVKSVDIIVSATLYHLNKGIADVCADTGVAYFDLTEDTEVSEHIRLMNTSTFMMPQSGLAPGAVNTVSYTHLTLPTKA